MNPGDTPPADPLKWLKVVLTFNILFIICRPELCSLGENIITYQAMLHDIIQFRLAI